MKKLLLFITLALSFTVNAQTIESVSPNSANAGETLQVTITGNNTDFSSISSAENVSFFNSTLQHFFGVGAIDIISDTTFNALLTIPASTPTGFYNVLVNDGNGMENFLENAFFVTNNDNMISGNIGIDVNGNGCDPSDLHMEGIKVVAVNGSDEIVTFTNAAGDYVLYVGAGNFTVTIETDELLAYSAAPASATVNFATVNNLTATADFCLSPNAIYNDIEVTIFPNGPARPGFDANYRLIYQNNGNQTLTGTVNFAFDDSRLDFISSSTTPNSQTVNNLNWNYVNLLPFETREIDIVLNVNSPQETPAVNIDDLFTFSGTANPISGDATPTDNTYEFIQVVMGAYDPNDKAVTEGTLVNISDADQYLHYLIRFQNSGTFAAENVVVRDMLSPNVDKSTLEVVSSSHPCRTTLTAGNKLEFFFHDINLPSEDDDQPGSNGFIAFKIKPVNTVVVGSTIENTADIYFDFNFPIITNTVATTFTVLGNPDVNSNAGIRLYPNPVKGISYVKSSEVISNIRVMGISGQVLLETKPNAAEFPVDLSAFPRGVYFIIAESGNGFRHLKVIKE